jgi:predicted transcriptional regulator
MSLDEQKYVNLGELELEVLDVLWEKKVATVKDILDELALRREIAYTTVMTVMTRLSDKGILKRHQAGRTYVYKPRLSRHEIAHSFMDRIKDKIFRGNLEGIMSYMITCETLTLDDLDHLRDLIREKEQKSHD